MEDDQSRRDYERRVKIFPMSRRCVVELLNAAREGVVMTVDCEHIPEDAEIVDIRLNWDTDAFDLKVRHSSFEPCDEGLIIPVASVGMITRLKRDA